MFRAVHLFRTHLVAVIVVLSGAICQRSHAQAGGYISVFADPSAISCTLLDLEPALFNVYIVHTGMTDGIIGSRFKLIQAPGFSPQYVSESIAQVHVGSVVTGIAVAYDVCSFGTLLLATVTFQGYGTSTACSYLDVGPDPAFGGTAAISETCFLELHLAPSVGKLYVNPESSQCQPHCTVVGTKATTWGSVKALYRE